MANRKMMVGEFIGGVPIHQSFGNEDTLVNPLGATFAVGGRTSSACGFVGGKPTANQIVFAMSVSETMTLPSGASGSVIKSETAAIASTTFTILKNSTNIGTITFAASAISATFSVASAVQFEVGDIFKIKAPAVSDTTLSDLYISIGFYFLNTANPNIPIP